jgi:hypothetical protein
MKNKEFEAIGKQLLPGLPGYALKGNLIFSSPIEHTLRGICFDRSSSPRDFYLEVFFMVLCVPDEYLSLSFGERVPAWGWNADEPDLIRKLADAIEREALPFLNSARTTDDLIQWLIKEAKDFGDVHTWEALAYTYALLGEIAPAERALVRLQQALDPAVPWEGEMLSRAQLLKGMLGSPEVAKKQLMEWEAYTLRNLKLDKFAKTEP